MPSVCLCRRFPGEATSAIIEIRRPLSRPLLGETRGAAPKESGKRRKMPSMITHAVVGAAAAAAFAPSGAPLQFWPVAILSATIADADALSFVIHGSYSDLWRHRGFFHSLIFGLGLTFFWLLFFPGIEAFFGRGSTTSTISSATCSLSSPEWPSASPSISRSPSPTRP